MRQPLGLSRRSRKKLKRCAHERLDQHTNTVTGATVFECQTCSARVELTAEEALDRWRWDAGLIRLRMPERFIR